MAIDPSWLFRIPSGSIRRTTVRPVWSAALLLVAASALSFVMAPFAKAQSVISVSPDVTIPLGAGNLMTADHAVAADNQLGIIVLQNLGAIPESADVIGYAEGSSGSKLLSFDTTVVLTGGLLVRPGDVVAWNGSSYSIVFDATLEGLPRGVQTDAIAIASNGGLLLSFDTDVSLPGSLHVADEDLVRWNGSAFSLALDGSSVGMSRALDVDAVDDLGGSVFLVSFDSGGTLPASAGSVAFADEDVLRHTSGGWSLERDGSAADADWGAADLDAMQMVPEPGRALMLAVGGLFLAAIGVRLGRGRGAAAGLVRASVLVAILSAALAASPSRASDGVLEINQSCAVNGGCFVGDSAGFPVTITASGSYRLSTNLNVPNENTDGIVVSTSHVRIDLDGFAIIGPVVCSGAPLACLPATGTGSGIQRVVVSNAAIRVENGSIRGMGNNGVLLGEQADVIDLRVGSNGNVGIEVHNDSSVSGSVVFQNGGNGVSLGRGAVVTDNAVSRNGGHGILFNSSSSNPGLVASGNSIYQNEAWGLLAAGGSTITGNTAYGNGGNGISAGNGSMVNGNTMVSNTDRGLSNNGTSAIAYTDNTMTGNGQNVLATGLINMGGNSCGGTTTCP